MKVLSIREPYATLIKEGKKQIETRSWKTNYRGELYIHASATKNKIEKKDLASLIDSTSSTGSIICKCNLVDCIYMTKEYIEKIKRDNPQEYKWGDYKEGRYAWILEAVTPLKELIPAHGQLGIWNYYNEQEVMNLMNPITYGWVDKNGIKQEEDANFNNYCLQSPKELIKSKTGVCWDQVELERYYFKANDWNVKTYYMIYYDGKKIPTHTFLTYQKKGKFYWFEHSWEAFRGIHTFTSEGDLLKEVQKNFLEDQIGSSYEENNLVLYEYTKPKYHLSAAEFDEHCTSGKKVVVD